MSNNVARCANDFLKSTRRVIDSIVRCTNRLFIKSALHWDLKSSPTEVDIDQIARCIKKRFINQNLRCQIQQNKIINFKLFLEREYYNNDNWYTTICNSSSLRHIKYNN